VTQPKPKPPVVTGGSEGIVSGDDTVPTGPRSLVGLFAHQGVPVTQGRLVPGGQMDFSNIVGGSGGIMQGPRLKQSKDIAAGYGFDYPISTRDSRR
jgi:hypothetical protein